MLVIYGAVFHKEFPLCLQMYSLQSALLISPHRVSQHVLGSKQKDSKTCDVCSRQFQCPAELKRHLLVHTGEKPFSCDICGKAFNRKYTLKVHRNSHVNH